MELSALITANVDFGQLIGEQIRQLIGAFFAAMGAALFTAALLIRLLPTSLLPPWMRDDPDPDGDRHTGPEEDN